jgi:hypothetical protein
MNKNIGHSQLTIVGLVIVVLIAIVTIVFLSQELAEKDAFTPVTNESNLKEVREIDKLAAEVRQIRSDTTGSLFWLKMIALFVTVGGAVGGYLVGQSNITRKRIAFENRKEVDSVYQSIVQELSDEKPILRAVAVVKLGNILQSFPEEWDPNKDLDRNRIIELTKRVLAASLSIENESKVLKTLTIAIVQHHPWEENPNEEIRTRGDLRDIDLSGAHAKDAYWANVDFSDADFYRADLTEASFKKAVLRNSQFREAKLNKAVLKYADCEGANFLLADLRGAKFNDANIIGANFEGAKVYGTILTGAKLGNNVNAQVDISPKDEESNLIDVQEWLKRQG